MAGPDIPKRYPTISESEAVQQRHAERRLGIVALLPEECQIGEDVVIEGEALYELKVDSRYQRERITDEVNELIHVIKAGGLIPQRVAIAVRPDGSRYLADGQQRWWAHVDTGTPMAATLYYVQSYDAEKKLFDVLNNRRGLQSATRIKAWHGETGKVLTMLNESPESGLRGHLSYSNGQVKHGYNAGHVVRGLTALISGTMNVGLRESLLGLDQAYRKNPRWATRAAVEFSNVLAMIWSPTEAHELRGGYTQAIGRTCRARWEGLLHSISWPLPTTEQAKAIHELPWGIMIPSIAASWIAAAVDRVEEVWPLPLVGGGKYRSVRA
jgi:hypothetical protein